MAKVEELERDIISCSHCGSTVRRRSIVQILSIELFGQSLALPDFPVRRDLRGLGMSDWDGYAIPLAAKFDYENTYHHREPRLDITHIDADREGQFDFIISTDVFEHVPPPISRAFDNICKLLKPSGVLIFSVPYTLNDLTIEHFPELYDYQLMELDGRYVLRNVTRDGAVQVFEDLVFHEGPGTTLEMRLFSERSLIKEFEQAGLGKLKIHKVPYFEFGIYSPYDWSLPMSVRKP